MKEYWFHELGYFTESSVEKIKQKLDGKSFMSFKVLYSNCCGNCFLGVATDYEGTEQEIKNFFIGCALEYLC